MDSAKQSDAPRSADEPSTISKDGGGLEPRDNNKNPPKPDNTSSNSAKSGDADKTDTTSKPRRRSKTLPDEWDDEDLIVHG